LVNYSFALVGSPFDGSLLYLGAPLAYESRYLSVEGILVQITANVDTVLPGPD
jgi:hypothetical protein